MPQHHHTWWQKLITAGLNFFFPNNPNPKIVSLSPSLFFYGYLLKLSFNPQSPFLPSTHCDVYYFKTAACLLPKLPPQPHAYVSSSSKPKLTQKTKPFSHKGFSSLVFSSSSRTPSSQNPVFFRNLALGYAAAIIDIAQNSDSLHQVQRDVQMLLGFLKNVNFESLKN